MVTAFAVPILLGFCALIADFGHSLSLSAQNQRAADLASYAGALAYAKDKDAAKMAGAASYVAGLNGIEAKSVKTQLVDSPRDGKAKAVEVTVTVQKRMLLAPLLGGENTQTVATKAFTQIASAQSGCILALDASGSGLSLTGTSAIAAKECGVQSNAQIKLDCSTQITADTITYGTTTSLACGGLNASSTAKAQTTDPLAGNPTVAALRSRFSSISMSASPAAPVLTSKSDIDFSQWGDANATKTKIAASGCAGTLSGSTWTVTCPSGGTYSFGGLTLAWGVNVDFGTASTANTTFNFAGSIKNSGGALRFGRGNFNISGNVATAAGGASISFGSGTFNVGTGTCDGGRFSICAVATSTVEFSGPSEFILAAGVQNGGTMTLGSGAGNKYDFGRSSTGDALRLLTMSNTIMADASLFTLNGHLNGEQANYSCLVIGAATNHDINGNFLSAGAVVMGAGVYSINGHMALAPIGGGNGSCSGKSSVTGEGVTIVLSGSSTYPSSDCAGLIFCVAGGYTDVSLVAPTSGPNANLAIVGPAGATGGVRFRTGTSATIGGAVYFPTGAVRMDGDASISSGSSCIQVVGRYLELLNNAKLKATKGCNVGGGAAGGSGQISLIQ